MEILKQGSRGKKSNLRLLSWCCISRSYYSYSRTSRVRAIKVSFEPKARTAWHTHPLGQTLFVLSGISLVGLRNKAPQIINVGDTVCG